MKRNSLLTLRGLLAAILGGIVILSSCNGDETTQGFTDPSREVTFSAYSQKGSRTRIAETTSSTIENFNVFAIWSGDNAPLPNLNPAEVSGGQSSWAYSPSQFWPDAGTIDFYAYSPDGATGLTANYDGDDVSGKGWADMSIDYVVPTPPSDVSATSTQQDLLVAVKPNVNCNIPGLVSLNFHHALSRIQLKARPSVEGAKYTVSRVKFLHLSNSGKLELSTANIPNGGSFTYNNVLPRTPLVLWTGHNTAATDYEFTWNTPVDVDDHSEYTDIIAGDDAFLVLPQTTKLGDRIAIADLADASDPVDDKFYVRIDFASSNAPTETKVKYFAVKEPLDPALNLPLTFEVGRRYTFVVDLSRDCIDFAKVYVANFNEAFEGKGSTIDITPDPDPVLGEDYMPVSHQGFAGSNIYWDADNKRLTFDDVDVTDHEQYQGVFFKWGSLVGISPKDALNGTETPIYAPIGDNGKHEATSLFDLYNQTPSTAPERWALIATGSGRNFVTDPIIGVSNLRTSGFVTYMNSDPANLAAFKGDICAYLSGRPGVPEGYWRLPISTEFDHPSSYSGPGPFGYVREGNINDKGTDDVSDDAFVWSDASDQDDGTFEISNGLRLTYTGHAVFFPASGYRDYWHGNPAVTGVMGYSWTSSPHTGGYGSFLNFRGSIVYMHSWETRTFGVPVRCVKK